MNSDAIFATIHPILIAFEQLGIDYYLGGSVVSSVYGIPRATLDIDVIADLRIEHVHPLIELIKEIYYVDEDMIKDAIKHHSSFNIIYLDLMSKVDIFLSKPRLFDREEHRRVQSEVLFEGAPPFFVASPEDIILHKLEWYRTGREISDRQWKDILGVLKTRGQSLDIGYMREWAAQLKVSDLLERALVEAGLTLP